MNFLKKIYKQEKLKIVEPSEEIKESYIKRSEQSLESSKALFQIKNYEDAIAMSYYSMYYSLLGLLFRIGIKCENHTASITILKEVFNFDNSDIFNAKKERIDKQYYVSFSVKEKEVKEAIETAEEFSFKIMDFIDKLNNEEINKYRNKLKNILSSDKD